MLCLTIFRIISKNVGVRRHVEERAMHFYYGELRKVSVFKIKCNIIASVGDSQYWKTSFVLQRTYNIHQSSFTNSYFNSLEMADKEMYQEVEEYVTETEEGHKREREIEHRDVASPPCKKRNCIEEEGTDTEVSLCHGNMEYCTKAKISAPHEGRNEMLCPENLSIKLVEKQEGVAAIIPESNEFRLGQRDRLIQEKIKMQESESDTLKTEMDTSQEATKMQEEEMIQELNENFLQPESLLLKDEHSQMSLKLMSESVDSLEESMQESFMSTDNLSAGEMSLNVNETDCETLESSCMSLENSMNDSSLMPLDEIYIKQESPIESSGAGKQKSKKKKRKKARSTSCDEGTDNIPHINVRPNYFVGVQISNSDIHNAIIRVQEDLVAFDPALCKALVDVASSHITLLIARIDDENALALAKAALDDCSEIVGSELIDSPIQLTFSGLDHFSKNVLYVHVIEDEHYQRLIELSNCIRMCFSQRGVFLPNMKPLNPHLTVAKMSKAPRGKGKAGPRKIDPSSYTAHRNIAFGIQIVHSLQLLSMNLPKDEKRYYFCSKEIKFGYDIKEINDHSKCCFPRRPIISVHRRSLSTKARQNITDEGPNLLGSAVGFTTALAASLLILYVVGKVSGRV
ncbi:hypothetical protein SK128_015542 [Halocaridina rubra]|uniref:A-kinase anchor protein 7-like phosphoesterase domain-containing protein n=1 Tax=Halocaridina rubra TaxID=373956 RepID=A0AAN8XF10_HALRR